jgi:hypothetical protein
MRAEPMLRCHGGTSRNTAGELHRLDPGFLSLECWYELRDNPDGPVSSKPGSPRDVRVRALAAPAISKMYLGYTLLKSTSLLASSKIFRGGENYAEGGTMSGGKV